MAIPRVKRGRWPAKSGASPVLCAVLYAKTSATPVHFPKSARHLKFNSGVERAFQGQSHHSFLQTSVLSRSNLYPNPLPIYQFENETKKSQPELVYNLFILVVIHQLQCFMIKTNSEAN